MGVDSIRRSFGRAQTAASAGARRQSPAGRSSAGDGVRREREQRERAAAGGRVARVASRESRVTGATRCGRQGVTGATGDTGETGSHAVATCGS